MTEHTKLAVAATATAIAMMVGSGACGEDDAATPGGGDMAQPGPGGDMPGGDMPGGDMPGGDMPGGDMPGGDTAGGDMPGGDMPGGDMPGGDTAGGDTAGGDMAGGDMAGGDGDVEPGDGDMAQGDGDGDMAQGDGDGAASLGCRAPEPATNAGNTCPSDNPVPLKVTLISDEFTVPLFVTSPPGDTDRLFVVERGGAIHIIDISGESPTVLPEPFIELTVDQPAFSQSETGLLGMAFHPNYPEDPRFFVNYTRRSATYIDSYTVGDDPNVADTSSRTELLTFEQPYSNHNGGMVAFGPDGCLFIGAGDGGSGDDPRNSGQTLSSALGKMLRIDVDDPETPAPGNMTGGGVDPNVWDYGLRNPWRFAFDRDSGDLYIGDVGQGAIEEIDVAPRGQGGINWGWKIMEGSECRGGGTACDMSGKTPPVDEYANAGGNDCVVGGYVYRGSAIPSLQGWYLYADNGSGKMVRAFVWDGDGRCGDMTLDLTDQIGGSNLPDRNEITSFGQGAAGELYMTMFDGEVYRIDAQ